MKTRKYLIFILSAVIAVSVGILGYSKLKITETHKETSVAKVDSTAIEYVLDNDNPPYIWWEALNGIQRSRTCIPFRHLSFELEDQIGANIRSGNKPVVPKASRHLSKNLLFPKTNIYNAEKVLEVLDSIRDIKRIKLSKEGRTNTECIIIGLLNEDIGVACKDGSIRDVIGYCNEKHPRVCVVSRYKLEDNDQFAWVTYNVFLRTYFHCVHCPNSGGCIMQDKIWDVNDKDFGTYFGGPCETCEQNIKKLIKNRAKTKWE